MRSARSLFKPDQILNHEMAHVTACVLEGVLVSRVVVERDRGETEFVRHPWLTREAEARIALAGVRFEPGSAGHDDLGIVKMMWALLGSPPGWVEAREFEVRAMLQRPDFKRVVTALTRAWTPAWGGGDVMQVASEAMRA